MSNPELCDHDGGDGGDEARPASVHSSISRRFLQFQTVRRALDPEQRRQGEEDASAKGREVLQRLQAEDHGNQRPPRPSPQRCRRENGRRFRRVPHRPRRSGPGSGHPRSVALRPGAGPPRRSSPPHDRWETNCRRCGRRHSLRAVSHSVATMAGRIRIARFEVPIASSCSQGLDDVASWAASSSDWSRRSDVTAFVLFGAENEPWG